MYDGIHNEKTRCLIVSKLSMADYLDKQGEIVKTKKEAFGLPSKYMMRRPDKLVFVDKVGSNTFSTMDGNVGGEKFLCKKIARPQIQAATNKSHFTVVGFTFASGAEPVMCAIIFAAKESGKAWVLVTMLLPNGKMPLQRSRRTLFLLLL